MQLSPRVTSVVFVSCWRIEAVLTATHSALAVNLGRFDIIELLFSHVKSKNVYWKQAFSNRKDELSSTELERFLRFEQMDPHSRIQIALCFESMSSVVLENIDALTEWWVGFDDWPAYYNDETDDFDEDDPLGLKEDGWVWVEQVEESLLHQITVFNRSVSVVASNLKIVAQHPFISNNDVFEYFSDHSEDKAGVYYRTTSSGLVSSSVP